MKINKLFFLYLVFIGLSSLYTTDLKYPIFRFRSLDYLNLYRSESDQQEIYFNINLLSLREDYHKTIQLYQVKKIEDNIIRRSEILFFGSLTFATFGGWFFFSVFNKMIYDEPFGKLRREQFLPLYLGCSIISVSVVLSDIFLRVNPKVKNIDFY